MKLLIYKSIKTAPKSRFYKNWRHPIKQLLIAAIGILITVVIPFSQVIAQDDAFAKKVPSYFDYTNIDIDIQKNGDMLITEKQQHLLQEDDRYRLDHYIALDKIDDIKDVTVSEDNKVLDSSTGKENGKFWIRWSYERRATKKHLFILKYRVIGGIQIHGDEAKIYWKAIFANRSVPTKGATIQVNLPESLAGRITNTKSWGVSVTSQEVNSQQFKFVSNEIVNGQELNLQLSFHKNFLTLIQPKWQSWSFTSFLGDTFNFFKMLLFGSTELAVYLSILLIIWLCQLIYYCFQALIDIFKYISDWKCDQCMSFFSIQREYIEITPSTHTESGLRHVIRRCHKCHYSDDNVEKTYELSIWDKICPMCKSETIEMNISTLCEATYSTKGLMRTNWNCSECHYTAEREWLTLSGEEEEEKKRRQEAEEREKREYESR